MSNYVVIDEKNWKRAQHCAVFRKSAKPTVSFTFEVDVTNFRKRVKEQGLSFTLAMVYAVCKCGNEIEEFRYRFVDGKVVLFDKVDATFTYLDKETELFKVVNVPFIDDMAEFVTKAKKIESEQKEYFSKPTSLGTFSCSAIPWITYTNMGHTSSGKPDNATPVFDWGKFYEKDGYLMMPMSVQTHHSFVDGIHIGRFVEKIQKYFDEY